jgi:hypothetical protein
MDTVSGDIEQLKIREVKVGREGAHTILKVDDAMN